MERIQPTPDILRHMQGRYFIPTDKGVAFLDPIHQRPIEAWRPPQSVLENERLGRGLSWLAEAGNAGRLTIQMMLSFHVGRDDFEDVVEQYPDVLERAFLIGIEAHRPASDDSSAIIPQPPIEIAEHPGRADFQRAQYDWLKEHGKIILPCEYTGAGDAHDELAEHLDRLQGIYEVATDNADGSLDPRARNKVRAIADGAQQSMRQWMTLGQMGYVLSQFDDAGYIPHSRYIEVPLMVGSWHRPSAQRLINLGV